VTLRAGTASVVITPPVGVLLDGYFPANASEGVHDDLHARAVVLEDGTTQVALVSCDLLGVGWKLTARARELATAATGIPSEHILIAATHTHAGPAGPRDGSDAALIEATARQIAGAIDAAQRSMRVCALKAGSTTVDSIGQNRRHPDGPVDTTLHVLLFDDPNPLQPPIAAAMAFACHATVLYHVNRLISADYFGHAARTVASVFPGLQPLTFNGACGDVNPMWIVQDHEEAERTGKIVGSAAARLIAEMRPLGPGMRAHNIRWDEHLEKAVPSGELIADVRLRATHRQLELPVREYLAREEYESTVRELEGRAEATADKVEEHRRVMEQLTRLRTERELAGALSGRTRPVRAEVMAVGLGRELALLGLPGEFFVETVEDIRRQAGISRLPVACYANQYVGYVVPPHSYAEGGYEAGITYLAPEAEDMVKGAALEALGEVTSA
jgi:hypothetical protein